MKTNVIVLFDFSPEAERALDLSLKEDAQVEVFHVVDEELYRRIVGGHAPSDDAARSYLEEYIQKQQAVLGMEARADVRLRVARGPVLRTILDHINSARAGRVMLGGQGHGGIKERLFGRTAQRVLRNSSVSAYIVKDATIQDDRRPILCAIDFGEGSAQALLKAGAIAAQSDRPLELVAVTEIATAPYFELLDLQVTSINESTERELAEFERRVLGSARSRKRHIVMGSPPDTIVSTAEHIHAGLIVLGSHRHSAMERVILGSTAESVAAHSPRDVLVVR